MRTTQIEIDEMKANAIAFLKKNLKPGTTVYTIVRHVSSSGMSRNISAFIIKKSEHTKKHELVSIDWYIAKAMDEKRDPKHGGIKVHGCGMDMCFDLVYRLGRTLYPKGFKLPKGKHGRNGDTSGYDKDGGYALHYENL